MYTGFRVSEVVALRWRNVHEDSITIDERYARGDWGDSRCSMIDEFAMDRCNFSLGLLVREDLPPTGTDRLDGRRLASPFQGQRPSAPPHPSPRQRLRGALPRSTGADCRWVLCGAGNATNATVNPGRFFLTRKSPHPRPTSSRGHYGLRR